MVHIFQKKRYNIENRNGIYNLKKGTEMDIEEYVSLEVQEKIRKEVSRKIKNKVLFFIGKVNINKTIVDVKLLGSKVSLSKVLKSISENEMIIKTYVDKSESITELDIELAEKCFEEKKVGYCLISENADDIFIIREVELVGEGNIEIDVLPYFEKKGVLAGRFDEFEYRDEQYQMAETIQRGLNSETKVIVEAGTGTGKTLAYLIPAIEWGIKNKKKVVITTNTINLQEQLLNKDLPIVATVLEDEFKYILVKGRGNYLCNRKLYHVATGDTIDFSELTQNQKEQLTEVIKWGAKTESGDKSELHFEIDYGVWELFQSESDSCVGNRCPFKESCFFLKAREEKKEADVLVTNHHMYFSDLAIRKEIGFNTEYSILPEYGLVVFDEAHNIEKVARDYFSYEVSRYGFTRVMNQIRNSDKKKIGSLDLLVSYLKQQDYEGKKGIERELENDIVLRHSAVFTAGRNFFSFLIDIYSKGGYGNITYRLKESELKKQNYYLQLNNLKEELILEASSFLKKVNSIISKIKDLEDKDGHIIDFSKHIDKLENFIFNLKFITSMDRDEFIYWVEVNGGKNNSKLVATPLKVGEELQNSLYENLEQMIFTSATIAVGDDFSYFKESIGLEEEVVEKVIMSPFDYNKQMYTYIPKDILDPNNVKFLDEILEFVKSLIYIMRGRTFLLFTSYSTLNYVYYMIKDELEKNGLNLLIQGQLPRTKLIELYKNIQNPVLFGTDSFWEGVDIKGEQLSSVIIVKLPFKVPNDPVTEAIIEDFERNNKNSFMDFQIPESIIKFKQGIGRLIRGKQDRGIVTILDNRIITKKYGKYFMEAIPTNNIKAIDREEILKDIEKLKGKNSL